MSVSKELIRVSVYFMSFSWGTAQPRPVEMCALHLAIKLLVKAQLENGLPASFREGDTDVKDKSLKERPSKKIDCDGILAAIEGEGNPTLTTRMLADDFQCSHTKIEKVLHEKGKKWRHA